MSVCSKNVVCEVDAWLILSFVDNVRPDMPIFILFKLSIPEPTIHISSRKSIIIFPKRVVYHDKKDKHISIIILVTYTAAIISEGSIALVRKEYCMSQNGKWHLYCSDEQNTTLPAGELLWLRLNRPELMPKHHAVIYRFYF